MRLYLLPAALLLSINLTAQTPATLPVAKGSASQAPEDLPIRSQVRNVLLDVTVLDKGNNPVMNLGQEHFTVLEDGKPQPLSSYEEMGKKPYVPLAPLNLPPHVYSNIPSLGASDSLYVLVLDSLNTAMNDQAYTRYQMLEFLKKLPAGSRIAIFGLSSRLFILQGFTADPTVLQAALKNKRSWSKSSILMDDPDVESLSDQMSDMMADLPGGDAVSANMSAFMDTTQNFQNEQRVQRTLDAFNSLALYLSVLDGRKNVIWFAGNFPLNLVPDMTQANPLNSVSIHEDDLRKTTALLAAKRISVYPVDARGLTTLPIFNASQSGSNFARNPSAITNALAKDFQSNANTHGAMDEMAGLTGGKAFYNTNGLSQVLQKVIEIGKNYYALSYSPPDKRYDGRFHKIKVQLDIPGYTLLYRNGYYATDPAELAGRQTEANPDPLLASMMRGTPDTTQIPFKIRVQPADPQPDMTKPEERRGELSAALKGTPARFVAEWAVDVHSLRFTVSNGTYSAKIRLVVAADDADGRLLNVIDNEIKANLDKQHYDFYAAHGLQFHQELDLPKGEIFLRTAVIDEGNNHSGATEIPLIVNPNPKKKPATTTPAATTPDAKKP